MWVKSEQTGLEVNVSEKRFVGAPHSRSHLKEIFLRESSAQTVSAHGFTLFEEKMSAIQEQKVGGEITKHARIHKSAKDGARGRKKKC